MVLRFCSLLKHIRLPTQSKLKTMPPPDRWLDYCPLGDVIEGTKFVAFKVPLKKELLTDVKENEKFGPKDVIQKLTDSGKQLGLVVDVTYTDKYYHKREFCGQNIEHEKIYAGGHLVPNDDIIYRFFDVVEKFIKRMKTDNTVIGVHCTHGVNRTGYIVCRYMIERLGIDPTEAMKAFGEARGHPIERQNYIDDLLTRKHNPDYEIGDHPPVLKKPTHNKHNRPRQNDRHSEHDNATENYDNATENYDNTTENYDNKQSYHGRDQSCSYRNESYNDGGQQYIEKDLSHRERYPTQTKLKTMQPPDRWLDYCSLGDVIEGTKFVAFKVPLKKELLKDVKENEKFGPKDVIQKLTASGKQLGLVVDVTYTDKYYHKGEFCRQNIEHEKIYAGGHLVPTDDIIYRFFDVVEKFIKRMKTDNTVIGVHCTHGVNRTGYIVCRYMVERLGIDPTEAMKAFGEARGHPIERQNYIDDLLTRKHNPDYVIGNHPPVLKNPSYNIHNRSKQNERHKNAVENYDNEQSYHGRDQSCSYRNQSYNDGGQQYSEKDQSYSERNQSYGEQNWNRNSCYGEEYYEQSYGNRNNHEDYHQRNVHYEKRSYHSRHDNRNNSNPYKRSWSDSHHSEETLSYENGASSRKKHRTKRDKNPPVVQIPYDEY